MFVNHDKLIPSDEQNVKDARRMVYRILVGLRLEARRMKLDEMEVRLVSDADGVLWINTGDVQYDTEHGAACGAGTISPTDDNDQLAVVAAELVNEVVDQLAELADEDEPESVRCSQCDMLSINGIATHEHGCPNLGARWDADEQTWVKQRKCFTCGCTVDQSDPCCSAPDEDFPPDSEDE